MKKSFMPIRQAAICILALIMASLFAVACAATATSTTESTGNFVDDSVISTKVKAALAEDEHLRNPLQTSLQIRVETYKGVVQLSGFVNSADAAARAEVDASKVPGVKQVVNSLVVKSEMPKKTG